MLLLHPSVAAVCVCNELVLRPAVVSLFIPVCRRETLVRGSETGLPSQHSYSQAARFSNINWHLYYIGSLLKL